MTTVPFGFVLTSRGKLLKYGNCGKVPFRSKARVMKEIRKLGGQRYKFTKPYQCKHCGKWHMTTQQPEQSKDFEVSAIKRELAK